MVKTIVKALAVILAFSSVSFAGENKDKVRIAFFPNMTHAQALVGKADGSFQKVLGDKQIEWKEFNAGSAEIEAFMAGEVDIGYIGPGPAINGYVRTRGELQIIAGASNAGAIFVSRKDLKISKIADFSGKRIAIPQFGNTQDLVLRRILHKNGLKEATKGGTVDILQAENADIKTLLDNKNIDGALVPEPWGSRLVKEIGANIVLDYKDVFRNGDYSASVVIVRKGFLEKNKDVVEKFLKRHIELTDQINIDKEKTKVIVNNQIKELTGKALSKDILDTSFSKVVVTYDPQKESIEEMAGLSQEAGFLRTKPDLKGLFNLELINKVLLQNGKKEIKQLGY